MARPKSTLLRILVPLVALLVVVLVALAVFRNTAARTGSPSPSLPTAVTPPTPEPEPLPLASTPPPPAQQPADPADPADPAGAARAPRQFTGLAALPAPGTPPLTPLGSLDPASGLLMRVEFSEVGAGVRSIRLTRFKESTRRDSPNVEVQAERSEVTAEGRRRVLAPLAASRIGINGQFVTLTTGRIWEERGPGWFQATIADEAETPVVRVTRRYTLEPRTHDLFVDQRVENLTPEPLTIQWVQYGPVEFPPEVATYGGDKRRVRFGYLMSTAADPARQTVLSDDYLWGRENGQVLGEADRAIGQHPPVLEIWPNRNSNRNEHELSWLGLTSRYFGAAVHPPIRTESPPPYDKSLGLARKVERVLMAPADPRSAIALLTTSEPTPVAPSAAADLSFALYAGPLSRPGMLRDDASRDRLRESGLKGLVVYNFGGPCGWCTFPAITGALLWLMYFLHTLLLDWSVAIILLVVVVRSILHPVNKWSQIRMQRLGKQMQDLAPKQKKIQEKYAGDRKKIQEETAKLWRESGVNPVQMVGCIPPFLQTPIWIALYAMLYFAVELRHQPAFYGLLQWATGGKWLFLADLSEPDRFIPFGFAFHVPLLSVMMGPIASFNILPILLGLVFYFHQKFITPPPSATTTPEQRQQMAIVKWMMVVLFPLMMYGAPSGLAIYFIANSVIAIFESMWIKHIIKKKDLLNPEKTRRPVPGGFLARMQELAEQRRQTLEGRSPRPPGAGPGPRKPRRDDDPPQRRFRERR